MGNRAINSTHRYIVKGTYTSFDKKWGRWRAFFTFDKLRYMGFSTREEAILSLEIVRHKLDCSNLIKTESIEKVVKNIQDAFWSRIVDKTTDGTKNNNNDKTYNFRNGNIVVDERNTNRKWVVRFYYDKHRYMSKMTREEAVLALQFVRVKLNQLCLRNKKSIDEIITLTYDTILPDDIDDDESIVGTTEVSNNNNDINSNSIDIIDESADASDEDESPIASTALPHKLSNATTTAIVGTTGGDDPTKKSSQTNNNNRSTTDSYTICNSNSDSNTCKNI